MKIPFVCPVCRGNGLVPNGFYDQVGGQWSTTSITPEICRSCDGTGIVWNEENELIKILEDDNSSNAGME